MGQAIAKLNYSHEAMIDLIVANPQISQGMLAQYFGYSQSWVSQVMSSDAFKQALKARQKEIINPALTLTVEERFESATKMALDIAHEQLALRDKRFALKLLEVGGRIVGTKMTPQTAVQNNFVVQLPAKAASVAEWASSHDPAPSALPPPDKPQ